MAPPLYYGSDRLSLPGIDKVYYGDDLKYTAQTEEVDYLKFTANTAGSTVGIENNSNTPDIEISIDGGEWQTWDYSAITLPSVGSNVRVRGDNSAGFSKSTSRYSKFTMTGSVAGSGNIMTLIDMVGETTEIPNNFCFIYAFYENTHLTSAPELPATVLKNRCYERIFSGCTALVTGPSEIPASEIKESSCYRAFYGCTSLVTGPDLPAEKASYSGYEMMFYGCTSLSSAPSIGLSVLLQPYSCCQMFYGCSSLKVCSTSAEGATPFFTCPSIIGEEFESVYQMFTNTGGTFRGTPIVGKTYYWYT